MYDISNKILGSKWVWGEELSLVDRELRGNDDNNALSLVFSVTVSPTCAILNNLNLGA
jgi:hypothetical protein